MQQGLKVSSKSVPHSVAGALAGILRERNECEMSVIGAGALNQAVKAIAIARNYLVEDEIEIVCTPEFTEVTIGEDIRTAIRLIVEHRTVAIREPELDLPALETSESPSANPVPEGVSD